MNFSVINISFKFLISFNLFQEIDLLIESKSLKHISKFLQNRLISSIDETESKF